MGRRAEVGAVGVDAEADGGGEGGQVVFDHGEAQMAGVKFHGAQALPVHPLTGLGFGPKRLAGRGGEWGRVGPGAAVEVGGGDAEGGE